MTQGRMNDGRNRVRDWLRRVSVLIAFASLAGGVLAAPFANPIVAAARTGSADPSAGFYRGSYYYCRSTDDTAIGVARARRLQDIGAAPLVTAVRPPPG